MSEMVKLAERVEAVAIEQTECALASSDWSEANGYAKFANNLWSIAAALRARAKGEER